MEWVPNSQARKRLFEFPKDTLDFEVLKQIWEEGVADIETLMPYLKTSIYRIISISADILTEKGNRNVALSLTSLPHSVDALKQVTESEIISRFLNPLEDLKPLW